MAQWSALSEVLKHGNDTVRFTWSELDRLVGGLPPSATKHRAWWSGDRAHVRVWRAAGYTLAELDPGRGVTFVRAFRPAALQQRSPSVTPPAATEDTVLPQID